MDMRIFDKSLNAIGVVDECISAIWTIGYFTIGEIKILAPVTDNNKELLVTGNIAVKHDSYIDYLDDDGNVWRRAAEITYVHYTTDETGQEEIEAKGYMITRWLNKRVITPQIQMTGTIQQIVNAIEEKNIGSSAGDVRKFSNLIALSQGDYGGSSISYSNEEYTALGDEIKDQCQSGKLGFDILVCERLKKYGFYLYKGKDLTYSNTDGNPPCVFSRDFDNVNEQEYENSTENLKNCAYVKGAADTNNVQLTVKVDLSDGATGLDLLETKIDASDISRTAEDSSGEITDISEEDYSKMLTSRGNTELASMISTYTFNSSINVNSNLQYKKDFDIGDQVTCIERKWGLTIDSRITQISQTFENGKATIEATFGESAPTLTDILRK